MPFQIQNADWHRAIEAIEVFETHDPRTGRTWRDIYKDTPAADVFRRRPWVTEKITDVRRLKNIRDAAYAKHRVAENAAMHAEIEFTGAEREYRAAGGTVDAGTDDAPVSFYGNPL